MSLCGVGWGVCGGGCFPTSPSLLWVPLASLSPSTLIFSKTRAERGSGGEGTAVCRIRFVLEVGRQALQDEVQGPERRGPCGHMFMCDLCRSTAMRSGDPTPWACGGGEFTSLRRFFTAETEQESSVGGYWSYVGRDERDGRWEGGSDEFYIVLV